MGLQDVCTGWVDSLAKCTAAFKTGSGLEQVIDYYNKWAQEGTYDETVCISNITTQ